MDKSILILLVCTIIIAKCGADFRSSALQLTNNLRAKHGAPPLIQDDEANKVAQAYAEKLAEEGKMVHSENPKYGENLYMSWSSANTGELSERKKSKIAKKAVKSWYSEIKDYDFNNPGFAKSTGHFTALIWKGTTAQGFGIAAKGQNVFVVSNYLPAGNVIGQFPENVARLVN